MHETPKKHAHLPAEVMRECFSRPCGLSFNKDEELPDADNSTGPLSNPSLAFSKKRRASALDEDGSANEARLTVGEYKTSVAASEFGDSDTKTWSGFGGLDSNGDRYNYDRERFSDAADAYTPVTAEFLEDYRDDFPSNDSGVGQSSTFSELEDYKEPGTTGDASRISLSPVAKKHCTGSGIHNKVLVIDGETFLLPEGRGDVMVLEQNSASICKALLPRLSTHPKTLTIDGQKFLLPRGGGQVIALGPEQPEDHTHFAQEEDHQPQHDEAEVDDEDIKIEPQTEVQEMETDPETGLEEGEIEPESAFEEQDYSEQGNYDAEVHDWIDNYFAYLEMLEQAELERRQEEEAQELEEMHMDLLQESLALSEFFTAQHAEPPQYIDQSYGPAPIAPMVHVLAAQQQQQQEQNVDAEFHDFSSDTTAVDGSSDSSSGYYDSSDDSVVPEGPVNSEDSANNDDAHSQDSDATLVDPDWASETTFNTADDEADAAAATAGNLDMLQQLLPGINMDNIPIAGARRFGPTGLPEGHISAVIQIVVGGELWAINVVN